MKVGRQAHRSFCSRPHALLRRALLPAIAVCILAASCSHHHGAGALTITPPGAIMQAGVTPPTSFTFTALKTSTQTQDPQATFSTKNTSVITVTSDGTVTLVTDLPKQTATITAQDGSESGSAKILTFTGTAPAFISPVTNVPGIPGNPLRPGATFKVIALADINGNPNTDVSDFVAWTVASTSLPAPKIDRHGNVTIPPDASAGNFTVAGTVQFVTSTGNPLVLVLPLTFTVT
jgi:hypothetical protein